MAIPEWTYLIRGSNRIFLTEKKLKGLEILLERFMWSMNGREFKIGCPDPYCLLNEEDWEGPIGVFNIRNPFQVRKAFSLMRNHLINMAHRELKKNLEIRKIDLAIRTGDGPRDLQHTPVGGGVHETFTVLMEMNSLSQARICLK